MTLGSASSRPDPSTLAVMLAAAPWFIATDADEAGDKAASEWPARAIRVRPPEGVKDWTELWQAGFNAIRYHWGRFLPMTTPLEELAAQRWGPASSVEPTVSTDLVASFPALMFTRQRAGSLETDETRSRTARDACGRYGVIFPSPCNDSRESVEGTQV